MKLALALFLALGISVSAFAATGDVGASIKPNAVDFSKLATRVLQYSDVTLSSTDMDTLNATPVTLVSAPGSGKVVYLDDVFCYNDYNTIQFELGTGTLDVRYGSSSGSLAAQFSNEFVEYNSDKTAHAYARDSLATTNSALVLWASSDVTAGNGTIKCRATYRTVTLSDI
jgi:hypothetical protein